MDGETYEQTRHQKILLATNASSFVPDHLEESIEGLEAAAWRNDPEAVRRCLKALIPQFQPPARDAVERDDVPAQSVAEARGELARQPG